METTLRNIFDTICYLFILLFVYTAASKIITIETLQRVLIKYPLIGKYNIAISYMIPIAELLISVVLVIPKLRRTGLILALPLMILFLLYILYMFISGSELPCSCGGILSKLSWQQHIWFNSFFVVLAGIGIKLSKT